MNLLLSPDQLPARLHLERPMTDEELMRFSAQFDGWPIEREANGDLTVMSPNGRPGSKMNLRIGACLLDWAEFDGRGEATGPDGGYHLPDSAVRAPDAAWYSHRKLASVPPKEREGYAHLCPEFIIELRSPSDRLAPLKLKMQNWLANGAELAWLIDPQTRTITIYRPNEAPEELLDPTSVVGTGPVAGFELIMERVWGRA